jgi:precorrin-6B methylase 2
MTKVFEDTNYGKITIVRFNFIWYLVDWLSSHSKFASELYEKTVGREYRTERDKLDLSSSKKVLHVGCGHYPMTALILSELEGLEITTIDHNEKAVKVAKKVIKNKKLNSKILPKVGNGVNYPLKGFDTIIISGCSFPKIKVVNHVLRNADKNCRIVIREGHYEDEILDIINSIEDVELVDKIHNKSSPSAEWDSLLIVKK